MASSRRSLWNSLEIHPSFLDVGKFYLCQVCKIDANKQGSIVETATQGPLGALCNNEAGKYSRLT
uniref:Uncharacterized protein n=1 Tax=Romanomermis culicivorax TaxID=13658 RepID=A0A915HVA4_ROMCU